MSDAYQCDRCGDLYEGEPQSTVDHDGRGIAYQIAMTPQDLCEGCSEKLVAWFEGVDWNE